MPTYRIRAVMETYAVVEIEAGSPQEAREMADRDADANGEGLDWSYETDFDSSTITNITEIKA